MNQEQIIQYLNAEAQYKQIQEMVAELLETGAVREDEEAFKRVCLSSAQAAIRIAQLRASVRGEL